MDNGIVVRPMAAGDVQAADQVMRLAFGTFIGLPDPMAFMNGAQLITNRWDLPSTAAFVAAANGDVLGSALASSWGSVAVFGPLTVRPDAWDKGLGSRLMAPAVDRFAGWGTTLAALFTFPHSAKHHGLYQKFGFWPRYLTPLMSKPVAPAPDAVWTGYNGAGGDQEALLAGCRALTDALYEGLDLSLEIRAAAAQGLGETALICDGSQVVGMAVCNCGPGSEAGPDTCYVKFAAVRSGTGADRRFGRLLAAIDDLAASRGLARVTAGVNTACHEAYQQMLATGFRAEFTGVAMERTNQVGYHRPGHFVLDDWR